MAIQDIVDRIVSDAEQEAASILDAAEQEAARVVSEAEDEAGRRASVAEAKARAVAVRDAETLLANARLAQRDTALAERRALIEEVLEGVRERIAGMPDERYAGLLARSIARSAAGGETLLVGRADADRLRRTLPGALEAAGVSLRIGDGDAGIEHGVVLQGDGTRVEISPAALVETRRDELVRVVDEALFARKDS